MASKKNKKKFIYRFHFFCAGHKKVELIESVGMFQAEMILRKKFKYADILQIDLITQVDCEPEIGF